MRSQLSWRMTRELGWVFAGQAAALVGTIGLTKVVASRLGTGEYGQYALGLTAAVFLNQVLMGPVTTAAFRFFSTYRDSGRLEPFRRALVWIVAAIVGVVMVIAVPVAAIVARSQSPEWAVLIVAAAVFGIIQNVFGLLNGLDIAGRHRARAAFHQALDPAVRLAICALLLWVFGPTALVAMLGVTVGMTLVTVSQSLTSHELAGRRAPDARQSSESRQAETRAAARTIVGYAGYFMVAGLFAWLQLSSDRWAVKVYLDDASVGIFAAAYQLASVPSVVLASCVSQFFSPIVFQRARDGQTTAAMADARYVIRVGTLVLIVLIAAGAAVAAVLGEQLIVWFTSDAYRESGRYVAPLVVGLGLLQVGHMLSLFAMSSNRLNGYLAVKATHGVCALVLNVLSVWLFGLAGLCWASVVSGLIYLVLVLVNNARIMRTMSSEAIAAVSPLPVLQS